MFCVVILVREHKSLKSAEVVFGSSMGGGGFSAQPAFHGLCFARPEARLSERVPGQSVIIYSHVWLPRIGLVVIKF